MVDIDRSPAVCTGPALPFGPHECADAVLLYCCKVIEHAHMVFRAIAFVQLLQPPAREIAAVMEIRSLHLFASRNSTIPPAAAVRVKAPPAPVLLPQEGRTDGAVHAARSDQRGPERIFPHHA